MRRLTAAALFSLISLNVYAGAGYPGTAPRQGVDDCEAALKVRSAVHRMAGSWVDEGRLARADGFIYAVDVGQLMSYFALAGDYGHYVKLRDLAVGGFIINNPSDPYTGGFVAWRHRPGEAADASGTTEALRIARALWLGAEAFGFPGDRARALEVLKGYERHGYVDQGRWFIRNYFNFGTRSFATNTFSVNFDPAFIELVSRSHPEFAGLAQQSFDLLKDAATPLGLIHLIFQPELKTIYPERRDVDFFSPNDLIQLSNSCTVATTLTSGPLRGQAEALLRFAVARLPSLQVYYLGRTGEAADNNRGAAVSELTCFCRLAADLSDAPSAGLLVGRALPHWEYFVAHAESFDAKVYTASEILLALHALSAAGVCP
jgi:hypothetical protein